jgi:hypothetical protein
MWDGRAGERAAEAILRFVADRRRSATVTAAAA